MNAAIVPFRGNFAQELLLRKHEAEAVADRLRPHWTDVARMLHSAPGALLSALRWQPEYRA